MTGSSPAQPQTSLVVLFVLILVGFAAERAAAEDRATLTRLRSELDEARRQITRTSPRRDARADREQLRTDHTEQLRDLHQAAEDRMMALTRALELAQATANSSRAQLTNRADRVAGDPTEDTSPTKAGTTPQQAGGKTRPSQSTHRGSPRPPRTAS